MEDPEISRRRIIDSVISSICLNAGFVKTEAFALETLAEMFTSFICQLSIQTKLYSELTGRTEANLHDVASALLELGIDFKSLFKYVISANQNKIRRIAQPAIHAIPQPPPILHTSSKRSTHLNYIHEHFPLFPDPHTYIVTESGINNEKEYQKTREIIAQQKLNIEKALVKFKLKNDLNKFPANEMSIFHEDTRDNTVFMIIRNDTKSTKVPSYWTGLLHYEELELISNCLEKEEPTREEKLLNKEDLATSELLVEKMIEN